MSKFKFGDKLVMAGKKSSVIIEYNHYAGKDCDNNPWFFDKEGGLHDYSKWVKAE